VKTIFRSSFLKDLKAVRDKELLKRLEPVIAEVENAESLASVPNLKQLKVRRIIIESESASIAWH
jgi:hypothetical protein